MEQAAGGNDILITRRGKPYARLGSGDQAARHHR